MKGLKKMAQLPIRDTGYGAESLDRVRAELEELRAIEDVEAGPTEYAVERVLGLVAGAGEQMRESFPYGYVMEDGEGGVRVEWEHQSRHVRLAVPGDGDGREYVYYQQGEMHGIDGVSEQTLVRWLRWLTGG